MEAKVVLDTTLLIDFIRGKEDSDSFINNISSSYQVCTTDINVFELFYGAYLSDKTGENLPAVRKLVSKIRTLSTTQESMELSAKIMANLDKTGQKVEMRDVLIAGVCLANSCPIFTSNKKHFEKMNVKIFDEKGLEK